MSPRFNTFVMYQSIFTPPQGTLRQICESKQRTLQSNKALLEGQNTRAPLHGGYIPVFIRFILGLMFYY